MPIIHYDEITPEFVTPKHSTAYGALAAGASIEVGRLSYKAGEGATPHQHPHEQIMIVIAGKLRVVVDGEEAEVGPGSGFHAPSMVLHGVTAIEDTEVISCKNLVDGVGHKI